MPGTPHFFYAFDAKCVKCDSWADWLIEEKPYCDRCSPVEIADWERSFWRGWTTRATKQRKDISLFQVSQSKITRSRDAFGWN